jgi:hypothetical protein
VLILFLFVGSLLYFLGVFNSWWAPIQGFGHVLIIALITLSVFYGIEIVVNHAVIPIGEHYGKPAHDWALSPDHREPAWDNDDETAPTPTETAITTEPSPATVATTPDTTAQESSCLTDAQKAMVEQASLPDYAKNHAATMNANDPLCATVRTAVEMLTGGSTSSEVGVAHTYEWATGDVLGDGSCYVMISQPDQSLSLPSNHGTVAQDNFIAGSPAVYDQRVGEITQAAVNDPHNKAHSCPMVGGS